MMQKNDTLPAQHDHELETLYNTFLNAAKVRVRAIG
jgi:hypothetical protein